MDKLEVVLIGLCGGLVAAFLLAVMYDNREHNECEAKGGILVKTVPGRVCAKIEVIK